MSRVSANFWSTSDDGLDFCFSYLLTRDTAELAAWFDQIARGWVTWTYYDEDPFAGSSTLGISGQENLRNRVAVQAIWNDGYAGGDSITGTLHTYYSYDIVGNVKSLVQDVDLLDGVKRIDYEYDFLSGNVNTVYYQRGQWDQFTHRYQYDANNRLTEVYTSLVNTDVPLASPLWDREATYQYYKHGPMARSTMGQYQVQGMDYAYTLQGWIKGVNSGVLDPDWDMGTDGEYTGTATSYVARDAFGYTINYFDGDYDPVGGTGATFELPYSGSGFSDLSPSLYNGNIRHIVSQNKQLGGVTGYAYEYDQLHRIKQSRTRTLTDTTSYTWVSNTSGSTEYRTDYTYDLNGNLLTLDRGGAGGAGMDLLTYSYYGNNETNLLNRVEDVLSSGGGVASGQTIDNYAYDGSGNLVYNAQENVAVDWVHYDKPNFIYRDDLDSTSTGEVAGTYFEYDANQNRVAKKIESYTLTNGVTISDYRIRTTYYVRDAQGNVLATYDREETFNDSLELTGDTLQWSEVYLYGSARLGALRTQISFGDTSLIPNSPIFTSDSTQLWLGRKRFEISNHLGNVTATISDRKQPVDVDSSGVADYYEAVVLSATDYFPFGLEMPGRTYQAGDYRFGFNGKEKDQNGEWGELTHYDYGFRIYNPGIGRFLSVDPLTRAYPWYTPYQFAGNKPTWASDLDGLEERIEIYSTDNKGRTKLEIYDSETLRYYVSVKGVMGGAFKSSEISRKDFQNSAKALWQGFSTQQTTDYFFDNQGYEQYKNLTTLHRGSEREEFNPNSTRGTLSIAATDDLTILNFSPQKAESMTSQVDWSLYPRAFNTFFVSPDPSIEGSAEFNQAFSNYLIMVTAPITGEAALTNPNLFIKTAAGASLLNGVDDLTANITSNGNSVLSGNTRGLTFKTLLSALGTIGALKDPGNLNSVKSLLENVTSGSADAFSTAVNAKKTSDASKSNDEN